MGVRKHGQERHWPRPGKKQKWINNYVCYSFSEKVDIETSGKFL